MHEVRAKVVQIDDSEKATAQECGATHGVCMPSVTQSETVNTHKGCVLQTVLCLHAPEATFGKGQPRAAVSICAVVDVSGLVYTHVSNSEQVGCAAAEPSQRLWYSTLTKA